MVATDAPAIAAAVRAAGGEAAMTRSDHANGTARIHEALAGLKANLYSGDFAFSVSRDEVKTAGAPLLILRGNDLHHPAETSEEIARVAPRAELVASWKEGSDLVRAVSSVKLFLAAHTPEE